MLMVLKDQQKQIRELKELICQDYPGSQACR